MLSGVGTIGVGIIDEGGAGLEEVACCVGGACGAELCLCGYGEQ